MDDRYFERGYKRGARYWFWLFLIIWLLSNLCLYERQSKVSVGVYN